MWAETYGISLFFLSCDYNMSFVAFTMLAGYLGGGRAVDINIFASNSASRIQVRNTSVVGFLVLEERFCRFSW